MIPWRPGDVEAIIRHRDQRAFARGARTGCAWPVWCGGDHPRGICGVTRYCRRHGGIGTQWGLGVAS